MSRFINPNFGLDPRDPAYSERFANFDEEAFDAECEKADRDHEDRMCGLR